MQTPGPSLLETLARVSRSVRPDANDERRAGDWLLRATGWVLLASVLMLAGWFFSITGTNREALTPLAIQAMDSDAAVDRLPVMREKLRTLPPIEQHRTGLDLPVTWLRIALPAGPGEASRLVHLNERHIGRLDYSIFDLEGRSLLMGRAGLATQPENVVRSLPGMAIELPSYLAGKPLEMIVRIETTGLSQVQADLWRPENFARAQIQAQQRTVLLLGALMFLAVYALSAASAGSAQHFLVFGMWLVARSAYLALDSGFHYFVFGDAAGSELARKLGQFAYLVMPFVTLLLARVLFRLPLAHTRLGNWLRRAQYALGAAMSVAPMMSFTVFQPTLWLATGVATIGIAAIVVRTLWSRERDATSLWFLGGVSCDVLAYAVGQLNSSNLIGGYVHWIQPEQMTLLAAVMTGLALGSTIARERQRRLDTQGAAIDLLGKYEAVYRTVPIGLVSIGLNGHIMRYNDGFARMFGLDPELAQRSSAGSDPRQLNELDLCFPMALRERIREELGRADECDFEFELVGHEQIRWLRVLARGAPDGYEASATDITAQKELESELALAARLDPLTNALNRLGLSQVIDEIVNGSQDIEHVALCYIDLDRFKMLNDMFGHNAGDSVLREVVQRLARALGPQTTIARVGGDEFVLVLAPADQSVQEGLAWRALDAITHKPFVLNDKSFSVTASIGVFHLLAGMSQSELIAGADRACQEAKRKGRNQVVMCADSRALMRQRVGELSLVARLHDERTFDEFELVGQPIVALAAGRANACEILLRHRSSGDTLVTAGPLIKAAEQNGEMARIDRWVLRQSLGWLDEHRAKLDGLDYLSMNLSGSSLNDEFFKTFVIAQLQKHAVVAGKVVLEITESVAMQDIFTMTKFIEQVRATGARIALDDFGSGYSNFASLTDVQASFLKIDGRFMQSLASQKNNVNIVRTVTLLAHELRMQCVAEWVEDEATLQMLIEVGADAAQGHLLARPLPLPELLESWQGGRDVLDPRVRELLSGHVAKAQAPVDTTSAGGAGADATTASNAAFLAL